MPHKFQVYNSSIEVGQKTIHSTFRKLNFELKTLMG